MKEISFIVDASYPSHCEEPYEIANQAIERHLVDGLPSKITCDVLDWQNDVTAVTVDPGPLSDTAVPLTQGTGTQWIGFISNAKSVAPGTYSLLIHAVSPAAQTDSLYDYVSVTVDPTPTSEWVPGPWPMLGHDIAHTARSPFMDRPLTPGLTWDSFNNGVSWTAGYSGASLSSSGLLYVASVTGVAFSIRPAARSGHT